ncbi:MAG: right-handed parallel beta-helix repeat-containing protein [Haloferacaceae archaeon]
MNRRSPATLALVSAVAVAIGVALVPGTATAAEVNDVSSCTTINASNAPSDGVVNLTADITDSGKASCLNVTVDNIVVKGQNHTIDGTDGTDTRGINVTNSSQTLTGVTIRNVTVRDWDKGVYISDASESDVRNVRANTSADIGVFVQNSDNLTVTNVTADANANEGIEFDSVVDSRIENATLTNNYEGVDLGSNVDNVTFVDGTVSGSSFRVSISAVRTTRSRKAPSRITETTPASPWAERTTW